MFLIGIERIPTLLILCLYLLSISDSNSIKIEKNRAIDLQMYKFYFLDPRTGLEIDQSNKLTIREITKFRMNESSF